MSEVTAGSGATLTNGTVRLTVREERAGTVALLEAQAVGGMWHRVHEGPLRFFALHAAEAESVTVRPAWEPGKPETNFALFHTNRGETYDAFAAGEQVDLALAHVAQDGDGAITCRTADGALELTIQAAPGTAFELAWTFRPPEPGYWSVGFAGFEPVQEDDVTALLAGPLLNERRFPEIRGVLPEGYLSAPFALVEAWSGDDAVTLALGVHPEMGGWDWRSPAGARYAIGARTATGEIQPVLLAPVLGNPDSAVKPGASLHFRALLTATRNDWWTVWRRLAEQTYGLRSYRQNIHASLTDTVHNMVELLADDVFSGWMEQGRGLLNIEHRDGVKLASPAAVLSAGLLTGDRKLLAERAQPILEYSISRGHYGFTWAIGSETVGQEHVRQAFEELGGPAWDAPVLVALHQLARGYTPALADLARAQADGIDDFYIRRSDFQVSLSLYHLTGDPAWLERAKTQADAYIQDRIDTLATDPVEGQRFLIHIGSDWFSLLDLWEATGEQRYLDAAERGARWFATLLWLGPVPDAEQAAEPTLTASTDLVQERMHAFNRHMYDDHSGKNSWVRDMVPYPRTAAEVPQETIPAWLTSPVGMSFEAWCTYRGRMVQNPGWAPYLLRMAAATGDPIYRVLAENAVVGRFTNYPGYYMYVHAAAHVKPDFPYLGPMDLTSIYYHHIPPQIGITLDYLFTQMSDRSNGAIAFPAVRDDSYVQFRHHLPGHAPGRFFDIDDAWPWLPSGLAVLDTPLVNWIAAVSGDGRQFGLALTNSSAETVVTRVRFDRSRLGLADRDQPVLTVRDADGSVTFESMLAGDEVEVTVPRHGLIAIRLDGTRVDEPLHRFGNLDVGDRNAWLTLVADDPHLGTIRAAVVGTGPGTEAAYVYTTLMPDAASSFTVTWYEGDVAHDVTCDRFPFELSVLLQVASFEFSAAVVDQAGIRHETERVRMVASGQSDDTVLGGTA